jgi:hypothetical protein
MLSCIFLSVSEMSGAEIFSYTKQVFQLFHDTSRSVLYALLELVVRFISSVRYATPATLNALARLSSTVCTIMLQHLCVNNIASVHAS